MGDHMAGRGFVDLQAERAVANILECRPDACFIFPHRIAGYPDLYILGAHGRGRKQVQTLVRRDDCCFGQAQHDAKSSGMAYADAMREYEARVRVALKEIGNGSFRLSIDETAPSHMISHHAIEEVLLPELRNAR